MKINFKNSGILADIASRLHSINHLPRWSIFVIDVCIVIFSLLLTYFLMDIWGIHDFGSLNTFSTFGLIIAITSLSLWFYRVSFGVVRHSSIRDILKISLSTFTSLVIMLALSYGMYWFDMSQGIEPRKLFFDPPIIFFTLLCFLFLSLFRFYVKLAFIMFLKFKDEDLIKNVMVFGTSDASVAIGVYLNESLKNGYNLLGFVSPSNVKNGTRLLDKKIYPIHKILENESREKKLDGILFPDEEMRKDDNQPIINDLIQHKIKLYHSPLKSFSEETAQEKKEVRSLEIEDLLYREEITIENDEIRKRHFGKNVLVTGGAGSIGSEIVRKVAQFKPNLIVVLDQAETPLNDVKLELSKNYPDINFVFHLANVSNKYRVEPLFKKYNFSMVYHAAAYKHVPIIEENPHEAIFVNILGSRVIADLSSEYGINRFVMVSTDKAVNPTNVMGASKRVAELYVQSLQNREGNTTKFITTRFGNVLGSNGSVIPLFRKQIEEGGPVTVTHQDITRYFMTIPEACELVLQAGTMGKGGEIYVFDMGEPVKIIDLAKKMIKLSGFEPNQEIDIKITGLRPGEKLYEELLSDKTKTLPTYHEKIMRAKDDIVPFAQMDICTKDIARATLRKSKLELVQMIKNIVPEYKSQNSEFESLD
ncbi:NAD-dependent epimerase/dehydratase family protein [Flavobacteriaceae bacterium Ap0902]|nr:NAD-dependent epimerase/dehydratase family protein [Flavobacteriaceae bacterium Ap0902]